MLQLAFYNFLQNRWKLQYVHESTFLPLLKTLKHHCFTKLRNFWVREWDIMVVKIVLNDMLLREELLCRVLPTWSAFTWLFVYFLLRCQELQNMENEKNAVHSRKETKLRLFFQSIAYEINSLCFYQLYMIDESVSIRRWPCGLLVVQWVEVPFLEWEMNLSSLAQTMNGYGDKVFILKKITPRFFVWLVPFRLYFVWDIKFLLLL